MVHRRGPRRARRPGTIERAALAILLAAALTLAVGEARAQDGAAQSEDFEPLPDQQRNLLNVARSELIPHLSFSTGVFSHAVLGPLAVASVDDGGRDTIIAAQWRQELWAAIGLFDWVELGVVAPITTSWASPDAAALGFNAADLSGTRWADVRLITKVRVLRAADFGGFGLALAAPVWLPTGDEASFNGEGGVRVEPRLIVDYTMDSTLTFAANVGYHIREEQEVLGLTNGDALRWSLGAGAPLGVDGLSLAAVLFGRVQLAEQASDRPTDAPMELDAALRYVADFGLDAQLGAGTALLDGVGAPALRMFMSVGYSSPIEDEEEAAPADRDRDGLEDARDACPDHPEDVDGLQDDDGCPEDDADDDGVADVQDGCPLQPEDVDGDRDDDGCPEAPEAPADTDGDGVVDPQDACPDQPEDADGLQDADGCPEDDADDDGVADVQDGCPLQPEDVDGDRDADGCPEDPPALALDERVRFSHDSSRVPASERAALDRVAQTLREHPEVTLIIVAGHADSTGPDDVNDRLSHERAATVRQALIDRGVEASRLRVEAHGERRPVVSEEGLTGPALDRARLENRSVVIRVAPR